MPHPDRVAEHAHVGAGQPQGDLAGDAVVAVSVAPPRCDECRRGRGRGVAGGRAAGDTGRVAAVRDDRAQALVQQVGVLAHLAVGDAEEVQLCAGREVGDGVDHLAPPDAREVCARGVGGIGIRRLTVRRDDHDDLRPTGGRRRDEPAGAQGLVVGVGGEDHETAPVEVEPRGIAPRASPRPVLLCRAGLAMVERDAHEATRRPSRARSRSAWCWRR